MISFAEALRKIQESHPDDRVVGAGKVEGCYTFDLISRSVNPTSFFDLPIDRGIYVIDEKTGQESHYTLKRFWKTFGDDSGYDIDLSPYLEADDLSLVKKLNDINRMLPSDE